MEQSHWCLINFLYLSDMDCVTDMAQKDISQYLFEEYGYPVGKQNDVWNVRCSHIFTKLSKKLNRKLKLNGINRTKNRSTKSVVES